MAARNNTVPIVGGLALVGAGYYMFRGNGNPKVAEKEFEHDAAKMSREVRDHMPGRDKEAKTEAKLLASEAGAKFDSTVAQAKAKAAEMDKTISSYTSDAQKKFEEAKRETGAQVHQAIDKFDNSVEKGAAQVQAQVADAQKKSSSWFGFGGK